MLNWNKLSLRNQLIIIFVVIQLLILGVIYFYFTKNQTDFYINQLKVTLENEGELIISKDNIELSSDNKSRDEISHSLDNWSKKWGKKIDARITMIGKDGEVLADSTHNPMSMDNHWDRPEVQQIIRGKPRGSSIRKSDTLDMNMLYLALPVKKDGKVVGFMRLAKSLQEIKQVINQNIKNYLLFFTVLFVLSLFLIWKFTSNLINPLQKISDMAAEIAESNFSKRIKVGSYSNEIDKLALKFNFMADQLEKKIDEISDEKNKAEAILSSMVDGVIATDERMNIILLNPAARDMFLLDDNYPKNRNLIKFVRNHRINNLLEEVLREKKTLSEEIVLQHNDEKIFRCHFAPITNQSNELRGGVIVFNDITELRRLEQVRKDFVANVSHELKTPLTSIIGYVDTLVESENIDEETNDRFLQIIKDEADRLSFLIQDLLDLSKFEQNNPELNVANFNKVIDKTVSILEDKAKDKNIILKKEISEGLPKVFMIKEQIEQVMINLIDNAIKYTPEDGHVTVRVLDNGDNILIEVEDDGIGIPEEDKERIFERFYRVDKARSRALGGTGIGLSIVKHIIQGHNSEIGLESIAGEGSKFWFYLKKVK